MVVVPVPSNFADSSVVEINVELGGVDNANCENNDVGQKLVREKSVFEHGDWNVEVESGFPRNSS